MRNEYRVLPILFNTDMVRAILAGRKTVTRRVIKGLPNDAEFGGWILDSTIQEDIKDIGKCAFKTRLLATEKAGCVFKKPPYERGDILYIRETWCWCPCWDCGMDTQEGCCDETANRFYDADRKEYGCYGYKASFEEDEYPTVNTWHPSIHMPKEVARIFLKVTDVRVERLQEMTQIDFLNEGTETCKECHCKDLCLGLSNARICRLKSDFRQIWNNTFKKSDLDRYGWDANPWVWVVEFEKCKKPEPCILQGLEPAEENGQCIGYGKSHIDDEPCEMCKTCERCSGKEEFCE